MSSTKTSNTFDKSICVLISLVLLSSFLPIQYIGGYAIISAMSDALLINPALAESNLFITFSIGLTLGEFLLGPLADKYGRLPIAIICLNIYSVSSLICAIHYSQYWFLFFRMISGFAVASGIIITRIIISDHLSLEHGASMLSRVKMYANILTAMFPLLINYAITSFDLGWLSFFIFNAILCCGVSIQSFYLLNKLKQPILNPHALRLKTMKHGFKETIGKDHYRRPLFAFLLIATLINLFSFSAPIITNILHGDIKMMLLAIGAGTAISAFVILYINKTLLNRGMGITKIIYILQATLTIVVLGLFCFLRLPLSNIELYNGFLLFFLCASGLLIALISNLFMICSQSLDKEKVNAGFITSLTISLKGFTSFAASMILPMLRGADLYSIILLITGFTCAVSLYYQVSYKKIAGGSNN